MRHLFAFLAAAMLFVGVSGHAAQPDTMVDLLGKTSPSVAALYQLDANGNMNFACTTTAVDQLEDATVLLTANHCVSEGVTYRVSFDGQSFYAAQVWKIPGYELNKQKYPRAFGDPETDMALFTTSERVDVPVVPLAETSAMAPGERVAMVGFPLGVAKISYAGMVSGYFDRPGAAKDGYQLLQVFGAPGSSGSAVVNAATGEVVSVLVSVKQARAGLPVIFATPVEYRRYLRAVDEADASAD